MSSFGASLLFLHIQFLAKHTIWFLCPNHGLLITILAIVPQYEGRMMTRSPVHHPGDRLRNVFCQGDGSDIEKGDMLSALRQLMEKYFDLGKVAIHDHPTCNKLGWKPEETCNMNTANVLPRVVIDVTAAIQKVSQCRCAHIS